MTFFPGFMFHLRRSQFVQVFGNSPDETAFARLMLMKESTQHCMLMIQPQLDSYNIDSWEDGIVSAQPTVLDVHSINPACVLFLDTYFYVVVYHGNDIARWRQEGYVYSLYCSGAWFWEFVSIRWGNEHILLGKYQHWRWGKTDRGSWIAPMLNS